MPARSTRKAASKAPPAKAPENRQFVVQYKCGDEPLSEEQKKKLIRNIKKQHYYYDYLSGKFKFSFSNTQGSTFATYLWKGGAGDWHEAGERVPALLTGDFNVLPEGVTAKLISSKEV
jgi:hypothetical protein